jgi:hypothetical protein
MDVSTFARVPSDNVPRFKIPVIVVSPEVVLYDNLVVLRSNVVNDDSMFSLEPRFKSPAIIVVAEVELYDKLVVLFSKVLKYIY